MQKLIFIFLIALSACVASSAITVNSNDVTSQSIEQPDALNKDATAKTIELGFNQTTQFENLSLRVINIEDSRCAIGVTCIWAGQIVVNLAVSNKNGEPVPIKLLRKRESEVAYVFGYALRLLNVEPHPKKGRVIQLNEQAIELEIVKTDND
ncbi:hypothetical protein [Paraglaciecola sp.]|uniref:hypothetical protein n=1 Tax=Paraglaciecola sp. TaxID=1920173 RepID=UPI0030F3AE1E